MFRRRREPPPRPAVTPSVPTTDHRGTAGQPVGSVTARVALFAPTPPTSSAPAVPVVTPGTVRVVALVAFTLVPAAVSNGFAVSTPRKPVIAAFHFTAVDSPQA